MAVATLAALGEVFSDCLSAGFSRNDVINRRCLWRVTAWIAAIFAVVPRPLNYQAAQIGRDIFFSHDRGTEFRVGSLLHLERRLSVSPIRPARPAGLIAEI